MSLACWRHGVIWASGLGWIPLSCWYRDRPSFPVRAWPWGAPMA